MHVDGEFQSLAANIRQLATEIPIATSEFNHIGEFGGQLGVSTGGLPVFIDTIAKIGVATRLSTETAALLTCKNERDISITRSFYCKLSFFIE